MYYESGSQEGHTAKEPHGVSMNSADHISKEDDIRDAREAALDQEVERSLRSLLRVELPDPEMEQRIKERLHEEWSRLYQQRSGPSFSSR
jgi:hypothetical protein